MKYLVRASLVAALVLAALAPSAAARTGHHGAHGDRHGHGHGSFRALVFSKTAAFRHTDCIREGTLAIKQLGAQNRFRVDATEDDKAFTDHNLAKYDVVIFLCTTGDVLNADEQAAFERFIRRGNGYAGIHSASDTEYDWAWYGGLVGAYFRDHPGVPGVSAQFQQATINVEDRNTPATRKLPARWTREEEWYNFRTNPRPLVHVLLSVDERTYNARGYSVQPGGSEPMGDHPIAWCHRYGGGRAFYTALGHKGEYWHEPLLLSHVLGGIEMAAGREAFRCG